MPNAKLNAAEQALGDLLLFQHQAIVSAIPETLWSRLVNCLNTAECRNDMARIYGEVREAGVITARDDQELHCRCEAAADADPASATGWESCVWQILGSLAADGQVPGVKNLPGFIDKVKSCASRHEFSMPSFSQSFVPPNEFELGIPPASAWSRGQTPNIMLRAQFDTYVSVTCKTGPTKWIHRPCFIEVGAKTGWKARHLPAFARGDELTFTLPGCGGSDADLTVDVVTQCSSTMSDSDSETSTVDVPSSIASQPETQATERGSAPSQASADAMTLIDAATRTLLAATTDGDTANRSTLSSAAEHPEHISASPIEAKASRKHRRTSSSGTYSDDQARKSVREGIRSSDQILTIDAGSSSQAGGFLADSDSVIVRHAGNDDDRRAESRPSSRRSNDTEVSFSNRSEAQSSNKSFD